MASNVSGAAFRSIRALFTAGTVGGLTDRELLEGFTSRDGDDAELAFASLVERHGPMVLRVCRTVLRDAHEAEDAFQATFLILALKARSIRGRDSLTSWLYQRGLQRCGDCAVVRGPSPLTRIEGGPVKAACLYRRCSGRPRPGDP